MTYITAMCEMRPNDLEDLVVNVPVRRDDQAAPGMQSTAGEVGDRATGCLAQRNACGEVNTVSELSI